MRNEVSILTARIAKAERRIARGKDTTQETETRDRLKARLAELQSAK